MTATFMEKIVCFKTEGWSMWPVIKPGEVVFVEKASSENINPGDSVVYKINNDCFLHRVVGEKNDRLLINDDTATTGLLNVNKKDIVGKLVSGNCLSKGFSGLVYSNIYRFIFPIIYKLKKFIFITDKKCLLEVEKDEI